MAALGSRFQLESTLLSVGGKDAARWVEPSQVGDDHDREEFVGAKPIVSAASEDICCHKRKNLLLIFLLAEFTRASGRAGQGGKALAAVI